MSQHSRDPRKNPGIKRSYLPVPDTIDGTACYCVTIPAGQKNKEALIDLLTISTYWFYWDRTDDDWGAQVAHAWRDALDLPEGIQMCCCHETVLHRMTEDGDLEISTDGGVTWTQDPDDPRITGTQLPNTIPGTGDGKKCNAASNALDNFKDAQASFAINLSTATTIIGLAAALAVEVALLLFTVGTAAEILIPLMISTATALFGLAEEAYSAEFTEGVWDDLLCCLFCTVGSDGQFTEAQMTNLLACTDTTFSGNVALTFYSIITGWGLVGLNNACISGVATAADCTDCGCNEDCIDASFIIHGTLVGTGSNYIDIEAETVTYNSLNAPWVVYGSIDDSYCCHFCEYEVVSGTPTAAGVFNCDGSSHGNSETDIKRVEMYGTVGMVIRIVLMPDGCA